MNPSTPTSIPAQAAVDLSLPIEGTQAASSPPAGGTPQALWAVAGAGVALVIGLAATAAVNDRQAATGPAGDPAATAPYAPPAPAPSRGAGRNTAAGQRVAVADPAAATAAVCATCGVVESVQPVKVRGKANGTGAVIGGVAGGVIGHEVGGNTAGTVLGAVGGGLLGHHIEKETRSRTVYRTQVRMDDGSLRTFSEGSARAVGSKVVVDGGKLKLARND